ncbi:hypothetical protein PHLGIDRAFT_37759 [Phlebiopsis gigantea 11061_1 CR5-6]|uniref:BTB domain-containing protein n=1 Tax=Phlebiopsis gigantea (strain 11061_1 CR5-6) TaxID=745531 RepID=A0A0C3S437_PHLG1|nr:hypothetical protein PHLGIDRAFT_37759 [Phlebiopsis gigantea 11061_1 CR5-6]
MDIDSTPPDRDRRQDNIRDRLVRADRRKENNIQFTTVGHGVDKHMRYDEDLWFEDGNILIVAGMVRFKLYRGILAKYSGVFRDMLEVADASAGDHVRGCPIVAVTDRPQHLVLLFTLLFDGGRHPFLTDPKYNIDFQDLRVIALLAFKYSIQHLQTEVVRRLQTCFPSDFEDWKIRYPYSCSEHITLNKNCGPELNDTLNFKFIDSIAVINLARQFNLDQLLPAAFYMCSQQITEDIAARVRYGDNDVEELSRNDLLRCLHGLEICRQDTTMWATELVVETLGDCPGHLDCDQLGDDWVLLPKTFQLK